MKPRKRPGRGWAYGCAWLGGRAAIAANIAHSFVPPAGAAPEWAPPAGAVISSVFWPVALFAVIEALARVAWPEGNRWVLLRFAGMVPVAAVAAVVSYMHLSGLLASYGAGGFEVHVGPLAVDGLMVIGTAALIATSPARKVAEPDQPVDRTDLVGELVVTEPDQTPTTRELWDRYAVDLPDVGHATDTAFVPAAAEPGPQLDQVAARRREDDELWHDFGDQLCREYLVTSDDGPAGLTRYRVEQVTGAARRQAQRLLDRVEKTVEGKHPVEVST